MPDCKLCLEPGLCEYGHVHNTLPPKEERLRYFPLLDMRYEPIVKMEEVDWRAEKEREEGIDYLRRVRVFGARYDKEVEASKEDTVNVFYSHAASVSLVAFLLKTNLEEVRMK